MKDQAGDSYRAAFCYDADDWSAIYVREELRTESLKESIPDAAERAREREAILTEADYPPLGETTATTELHEDGVLIHFREGENSGTVISLGRDAARRLAGFVTECLYILDARPSPGYEATPTTEETGPD